MTEHARELTEERRGQIIRLLQTLDEGLPLPARAPLSSLGFVHRTEYRESCPDCLANGFVSRECETCGGAGYVEGRRTRDPYDTGQNRGWLGAAALEAAKERDREIARLEQQTAPPQPEASLAAKTRPEPWELERKRLRDQYDLDAAASALERLRGVDGDAYHALHAVFVYGWMTVSTPAAEWQLERGLQTLDCWLPERLRAPAPGDAGERRPLELRARNAEIRRASKADSATSQWLARQHGLSVSQVNRILAGEEDPA